MPTLPGLRNCTFLTAGMLSDYLFRGCGPRRLGCVFLKQKQKQKQIVHSWPEKLYFLVSRNVVRISVIESVVHDDWSVSFL